MRTNKTAHVLCFLALATMALQAVPAGAAGLIGQVAKITAADAAAYDYFGRSVSVSGGTAIVSASGSAYVFELDQGGSGNWARRPRSPPPMPRRMTVSAFPSPSAGTPPSSALPKPLTRVVSARPTFLNAIRAARATGAR
jgi:hypothetical protein